MDNKITIGFHFINEFGDEFNNESKITVYPDLGITELDEISEHLNQFLRQIGYIRPNENIFMEDLTDEEYDAVADFLSRYREERTETVEN